MIVALSLCLTFFAWYYSKRQLHEKLQVQFDRESDQVVELVKERMTKYEDALWGGVAFIETSNADLSDSTWARYASAIEIEEKYSGINGIGVIHALGPEQLPDYLAAQRIHRPAYRIHPEHTEVEFWPITQIEPLAGNEKAVGLDMAHEINRYTAARKARDTGQAQITGPITLVQDASRTPGFLFFAPFYQPKSHADPTRQFVGMVYAPFVMKKLLEGVLDEEKRHVGLRIADRADVLFDEHVETEDDYDPHPLFKRTVDVSWYGRTWTFDIWSAKSFRAAASNREPLTILLGGLFIDSLLIGLFVMISRASRQALALADASTTALQARATELRESNQELEQFNQLAVGRETQMIELKREVNDLSVLLGGSPRYRMPEDQLDASLEECAP